MNPLTKQYGWGQITAVGITAISWAVIAGLGYDANPGILLGTFLVGVWNVKMGVRNG